ncbi:MAG: hypothetical protein QOD13_1393 [Thermoleophilaceae bacterium]|nr:hypothetical protein [Thermoleophilaceae bacterium]
MAVAVVMDFEDGTLDQYDTVIRSMGFSPGGPGAPGSISHWVTETDNGIRVTDVWETREQFEQFAEEQIGPKTAEAGIPNPPQVTFHDVHNHMTAG